MGIQSEMSTTTQSEFDDLQKGGIDANKIQYVILLEKKISLANREVEELRREVSNLKQYKHDELVQQLKMQLDNMTQQRDELLRDHGKGVRDNESRERDLVLQIDELTRSRNDIFMEYERKEYDYVNRITSLTASLEQAHRQRDDLLSEQRQSKRDKEELVENLMRQLNLVSKEKDNLVAENMQLRKDFVHLAPINGDAATRVAMSKFDEGVISSRNDLNPGRKPPSVSLKSKLDEWNKQKEKIADEQHYLRDEVN
jgi:hypothetical protein